MTTSNNNICDVLEEIAIRLTTGPMDDDMIQLASSPVAHSIVQGMVERHFHTIHLRDFYSVINYLLLKLSLMERERGERETAIRKQVHELQQKNKERKAKYEELYRINQQWSADYKDLQKQLLSSPSPSPSPNNSSSSELASSEDKECTQCVVYERELAQKRSLLIDLNQSLEKLKVKDSDWSQQLKDKEDIIQELINECSALRYQFQEIGGLSVAMRLKDDKKELTKQIHKLKERNTDLERDRAKLQTQFNRFRQSVRQILLDSASSYTNHTHYHTTPPIYDTPDVRIPPGMASQGYIYPKAFAPRTATSGGGVTSPYKTHTTLHTKQPPTPPGFISRGINGSFTHYYEPHPYKPHTLAEQVTGRPHPPQGGQLMTSSQFLEPTPPTQLLSPVSVPRPMSAPGSLLVTERGQTSYDNYDDHTLNSHTSNDHTPNTDTFNGHTHIDHTPISHAHNDSKRTRPSVLQLNTSDGYHSNDMTPLTISSSSGTHYYCPQCNVSFPRQPESCDALLEHLTTCTH